MKEQISKELTPRKIIEIEGKIHYSESFQAWNTLMLKKELFSEFPQLKEQRSKFSYKLAYCKDNKDLEKEISSKKDGTIFILRIIKEN